MDGDALEASAAIDSCCLWLLRVGIDHSGKLDPTRLWDFGVRGAILADLWLSGRVVDVGDSLQIDTDPTGLPYLDTVRRAVGACLRPRGVRRGSDHRGDPRPDRQQRQQLESYVVTMNRYVVVIVAAFSGMVVLNVLNKLHALGGWSTPLDIAGSFVLLVVAGVAFCLGIKRDRRRSRPGDDYYY